MSRKFIVHALMVWGVMSCSGVLRAQENWFGPVGGANCRDFKYLSIAFADQALQSPVSMFGHTFLVLHNELKPEIDAMTIEFVGEANDFAMWRALFWSIPGRFVVRRLAYKLMEYGREGRDVRVWRIGGVAANCGDILAESLSSRHEYSFLRRNCAWYAARLAARLMTGGAKPVQAPNPDYQTYLPLTIPVRTLDPWVAISRNEDAMYPSGQRRGVDAAANLSAEEYRYLQLLLAGYDNNQPMRRGGVARAVNSVANVLLNAEPAAERRRQVYRAKKSALAVAGVTEAREGAPGVGDMKVRRRTGAIGIESVGVKDTNAAWRLRLQPGMKQFRMPDPRSRDASEIGFFDVVVRSHAGVVALERFGLFRLVAGVPGGLLVQGFTRMIDVAVENHFDDRGTLVQRESGLRFGGGVSHRTGNGTLSLLAVGTLRYFHVPGRAAKGDRNEQDKQDKQDKQDDGGEQDGLNPWGARASARLRWYFPLSQKWRLLIEGEQFADRRYPVTSTAELTLVHDLSEAVSMHVEFRSATVGIMFAF